MAEIHTIDLGLENGLHFIFVEGPINRDDGAEFMRQAINIYKAVVFFKSPGGNVEGGVSIGGQIRSKGFATIVAGESQCASAAAIAWLGGIRRYMEPGSRIGFHASSRKSDEGIKSVSSTGNAVIGGYLSDLGLTRNAIRFITQTEPDDIYWMTRDDARNHGIEVLSASSITSDGVYEEDTSQSAVAIAVRAAENFKNIQTVTGMIGIRAEISEKYDGAAKTHNLLDALEVFILDWIAGKFDEGFMNALNMEQVDENNKVEVVNARINALLAHYGYSLSARSEIIENWENIAQFALTEMWSLFEKDDRLS